MATAYFGWPSDSDLGLQVLLELLEKDPVEFRLRSDFFEDDRLLAQFEHFARATLDFIR